MHVEQILRLMAGFFVMLTVGLFFLTDSPWFLAFTAFVGLNLFQSSFTNWCPAMTILKKLGVKDCQHAG